MAIVELLLPPLPSEIKTKVRLMSNKLAYNDDNREWINEFHNYTVNSVNHSYIWMPELDQIISEIYQKYFNEPIKTMIGIQRNVNLSLGCTPPHCDRARNIAINYYIDLGGENVLTNFYNNIRSVEKLSSSTNFKYNEIDLVDSNRLVENTWYMFNVQQCHSVENIETLRIFLGIVLESNPKYEEFVYEYKKYIK
jgi:hypothetical protein